MNSKDNVSSKPLNVYEEYENIISTYINNKYKIVSQSEYHIELRKACIPKYIVCMNIIPYIVGICNRFVEDPIHIYDRILEHIVNFQELQISLMFTIIVLITSIFFLVTTKENEKVFIRITKTGDINITGNTLYKYNKNFRIFSIIIIIYLIILILSVIIGGIAIFKALR